MICINGVKKERMWNFCGSRIGAVEEYKYLGVTVNSGLNGGFKSMGDRMVDGNGVGEGGVSWQIPIKFYIDCLQQYMSTP